MFILLYFFIYVIKQHIKQSMKSYSIASKKKKTTYYRYRYYHTINIKEEEFKFDINHILKNHKKKNISDKTQSE